MFLGVFGVLGVFFGVFLDFFGVYRCFLVFTGVFGYFGDDNDNFRMTKLTI